MNHNKMISVTIGISGIGPGGGEVFLRVIVLSQKGYTEILKQERDLPMELGTFNCIRRKSISR